MIGISYYSEVHMAQPCAYIDSDSQCAEGHKGHRIFRDCYNETWNEPPLPWVKRRTPINILVAPRYQGSNIPRRSWHLAIGIRKDSGEVQVYCNVGTGPGPFAWREKPTLKWQEEPGQWFCRRCVAEWTKGVHSVTVRVDEMVVTKKQLEKLLDVVGTGVEIRLKPTEVEDKTALLATVRHTDQKEEYEERFLVVGDGVVKL